MRHGVADVDDLVARGEDGHDRTPPHAHDRFLHAGDDADFGRMDRRAVREHDVARAHVLAALADVRSAAQRFENTDLIRSRIRNLDMRDRIRPLGHQRASHDPDRRAGLDTFRGHRSCRKILDDAQCDRRVGDVVGADGVSIHRGVVALRHVDARVNVLAQHAPAQGPVEPFAGGVVTH